MYVGGISSLNVVKLKKMANLNDVKFSQTGESSRNQTEIEVSQIAVDGATKVEQKFVIFKLVDTNKKGGVYIPNVDDVYNPDTKTVERIRLLSGIPTIWVKEQGNLDKDFIRQNSRSLEFPRGTKILRIPVWDATALSFARTCRHNIGSPNRKTGSRFEFFEYDPEAQQKAALEKEMLEIDMAIKASQEPEESMRKHANFLGIVSFDEFGIPKSPDGIRREYVLAAKRNPKLFEKTLGTKDVEVSYLIKRAISDSKIDLGSQNGSISWASGGGIICKVPAGRKANEYLLELALTNSEEGKKFLHQLESFVK